MKNIRLLFLILVICLNCLLFPKFQPLAAADKVTIYIAGDSTACNYEAARSPRTGWGQVLEQFFTDQVNVANEAISGRSSKSFIEEGALDRILSQIKPNDYLFIQFGHNDQKKSDPLYRTLHHFQSLLKSVYPRRPEQRGDSGTLDPD